MAASLQTSVATPKTTISSGSSAASSGSVFGFVKTSKVFFSSRISRRPADQLRDEAGRERHERERQRVALLRLEDLLGAARSAQAVRRERVAEVGRVGDLGVGQLVVVGGRDVRAPAARPASTSSSIAGATSFAPGT